MTLNSVGRQSHSVLCTCALWASFLRLWEPLEFHELGSAELITICLGTKHLQTWVTHRDICFLVWIFKTEVGDSQAKIGLLHCCRARGTRVSKLCLLHPLWIERGKTGAITKYRMSKCVLGPQWGPACLTSPHLPKPVAWKLNINGVGEDCF